MPVRSSARCWPRSCSTALHVDIRTIFYLAVIPGLLAFLMVLLVKEQPRRVAAKSKIDISLRRFPKSYWKYLLATALFGLGNSSNAFLILRTQDIGASLEKTILIYAAFNLVAALISYPAGSLSDRWGRRNVLLASFVVFFDRLSRLCADAERPADRGAVCLLRNVSGDISRGRQGDCIRLRAGRNCAQAASAGTARPSGCCSSWPASSLDCCGTGSAMSRCSITARCSR